MQKRWIGAAAVIAAAVCAPRALSAQEAIRSERQGASFPSRASSLADHQPMIAPFGENGRCEKIPLDDGTMVLLSFENGPNSAARNASITFSPSGEPLRYSDVRGDLGANGPRSVVTVDLRGGPATAMNLNVPEPSVAIGPAEAALDMANLGTPRAMIERIKRECGTGAK
jgi:hypothetical protein